MQTLVALVIMTALLLWLTGAAVAAAALKPTSVFQWLWAAVLGAAWPFVMFLKLMKETANTYREIDRDG